ncbi:torsin-1A-like [Battus philenor]|uniref:torsin-1A-like n=1 Tax=Battus philenor TaxID=42288 RepID=UPI0035CFC8EF
MIFKLNFLPYIFLFILVNVNYGLSEILSMVLLGGGTCFATWFGWSTIQDNTVCRYMECCNKEHIPYDLNKLKISFSQRLFGQPLVNELVNILTAHKESIYDSNRKSSKALVISLHGWSGVGKNYATSMIAEAIYAKGMESKFVKIFMGKKDFDCTDKDKTKKELIAKVNQVVSKCSTSLIIFDEIHDMCPDILDTIKPMLDHHHAVDGIDYRNSIFIFISNTGGPEITSNLLELYSQGITRNEVKFHHFEPTIRRSAYYTGGFEKSSTIAQHLIDHYIPFLPLEQRHVEMCALAEFRSLGVFHPTEQMMADALSIITYGPSEEQPIFANNGCKRFIKHIPYIIQKYKTKEEL